MIGSSQQLHASNPRLESYIPQILFRLLHRPPAAVNLAMSMMTSAPELLQRTLSMDRWAALQDLQEKIISTPACSPTRPLRKDRTSPTRTCLQLPLRDSPIPGA